MSTEQSRQAAMLIEPTDLLAPCEAVLFDCRFSLANARAGRELYEQGHIPGAHYLDLNLDLAAPPRQHGGRHPLPDAAGFAVTLARYGVHPGTAVVAYDDSCLAFAARLWWLMRALGYRPPRLLNGGYSGFLLAGGEPESGVKPIRSDVSANADDFLGHCAIDDLLQAQEKGALLIDSRESRRYEGLEEPIDPVAGHIPGAVNRPWQGVTDEAGRVCDAAALKAHWGAALAAPQLVVYCGSGVTACVNLFSLALLGQEDALLYAGSWSDWCSYL